MGDDAVMGLAKWRDALDCGHGPCARRLAALVLPGAFCPVHTQHLRLMEAARAAASTQGWFVAGGFLAPSDDVYVMRKLGNDQWPLAVRLRLCRLATTDSDWIDVVPWAEYGSFQAARRVRQSIEAGGGAELQGRQVDAIVVMGSDTAVRVLRRLAAQYGDGGRPERPADGRQDWLCCVPRPGPGGGAEIAEVNERLAPPLEAIGLRVIVASVADGALLEVDSASIRRALGARDWTGLQRSGWLHPAVLAALRASA